MSTTTDRFAPKTLEERREIVAGLLAALPDTPEKVAAFLLKRGHHGVRQNSCQCPLARYLEKGGAGRVRVLKQVLSEYRDEFLGEVPEAAFRFVLLFDGDAFPGLDVNQYLRDRRGRFLAKAKART